MTTIRNLEAKDAPAVAWLIPQLTKNIAAPEKLITRIEVLALADNCQYLVAESDGVVVGFGGLAWYPIPSKGLIGWVEELVVDEKHRGQGVAKTLLEELLEIASQKELNTVKLTSVNSSTDKLYEQFGFVKKDHQYFAKKMELM